MNIAGRNAALPHMSVTEAIRFFQNTGFDALELSPLRGQEIVLEMTEDFMIRHILSCVREQPGFFISALSCHANYATDDFIYSVQEKLLRCAHAYGTDTVIMSTYVPYAQRERQGKELYERLITKTRSLCRIAEEEGVQIAIEVEPNQLFRNLDTFFQVSEAVGSPALKLNFDIGHIFLTEPDMQAAIDRSKGSIVHGHIDNMCRGEHCHKLPWEGDLDLPAVCQMLKDSGFDGTLALDLYIQDYAQVSPRCVQYIRRSILDRLIGK